MVGAEGEDQAAGDRVAVHRRDHGPREPVPGAEDPVDPRHHLTLLVGRQGGHELQVDAAAEESSRAGDHDRRRRVGAQLSNDFGALVEQRGRHRVRGWALEPHNEDLTDGLGLDELGHPATIATIAAAAVS